MFKRFRKAIKRGQYDRSYLPMQDSVTQLLSKFSDTLERNQAGRTAHPAVYLGDYTLLSMTDFGCKIYLDSRDISLTPHIALQGVWETWIANVFRMKVAPNSVVVDIGCNVGYYTLAACQVVGQAGHVIAIDANPRMTDLVNRSLSVNGFLGRSQVFTQFVGDKEELCVLRVPRKYMGSASKWMTDATAKSFGDQVDEVAIQQKPLAGIIGDRAVDVLKIDAEGAEPIIWRGAREVIRRSPQLKIFMEWAPSNFRNAGFDPAAFLDEISDYKFSVQEISTDSQCIPVTRDRLLSCEWMELFLVKE